MEAVNHGAGIGNEQGRGRPAVATPKVTGLVIPFFKCEPPKTGTPTAEKLDEMARNPAEH